MDNKVTFTCSYDLNGEGLIISEDADPTYLGEFIAQVEEGLLSPFSSYVIEVVLVDGKYKFIPTRTSLA